MSREIMTEFAKLTGLSPTGEVLRRYLWTDAFAVCNFLELYGQTSDEKYKWTDPFVLIVETDPFFLKIQAGGDL